MLCEEKLEVFENGFEDGKFKLRVEFYGKDARKLLLAVIRELYLQTTARITSTPSSAPKISGELPWRPVRFIRRNRISAR